jgi:hypothetical protein
MSDKPTYDDKHNQPPCYEIRLLGHLDRQWTDWFGGMTITHEKDGTTLLSGPVADQAALHGLLKKVRDLGMPLVSVSPIEPGQTDGTNVRSKISVAGLFTQNQPKEGDKNEFNP